MRLICTGYEDFSEPSYVGDHYVPVSYRWKRISTPWYWSAMNHRDVLLEIGVCRESGRVSDVTLVGPYEVTPARLSGVAPGRITEGEVRREGRPTFSAVLDDGRESEVDEYYEDYYRVERDFLVYSDGDVLWVPLAIKSVQTVEILSCGSIEFGIGPDGDLVEVRFVSLPVGDGE